MYMYVYCLFFFPRCFILHVSRTHLHLHEFMNSVSYRGVGARDFPPQGPVPPPPPEIDEVNSQKRNTNKI